MMKSMPLLYCPVGGSHEDDCEAHSSQAQRTRGTIITSLLRDVATTSFWRNDGAIITSCTHWKVNFKKSSSVAMNRLNFKLSNIFEKYIEKRAAWRNEFTHPSPKWKLPWLQIKANTN